MQPDIPLSSQPSQLVLTQNKVLRNTYMMLSLTMIPTVIGAWFGISMNFAFMAQHPKVTLDVTLADRMVDLVEEGFDMAVRIARLPNSSLVSRQLTSTRMVLCATPVYLQTRGYPSHPSELADHDVLSYSLFSMGDQWEFIGPEGSTSVKVTPRLRTNSGDTCRVAALRHQGIMLQPSFLVGPDLLAATLVELMPAWRSIELGVYAVYPSRKLVSPKVRLMIEFLVNAFRMRGWPA